MDIWKYYHITHLDHVICNPISREKLRFIVNLLRLPEGTNAVDIGCGKAELLIQLAEKYKTKGLGIDISPYCIRDAQARAKKRNVSDLLVFKQENGSEYEPEMEGAFDVASCLGASWIYDGFANTVETLCRFVKRGGYVLVGEPFWLKEPDSEYLYSIRHTADQHKSHVDNIMTGESKGVALVYSVTSTLDEWDRYEGLQWCSAVRYVKKHPEDKDIRELLERMNKGKYDYLKWGRDTMGWGLYVFQKH